MAIPTSVASAAAVEVTGVGRVFQAKGGPVTALRDIDLRIEPGELFGVLGPNGAGKSTLIKILSTLLLPSTGSASIFGLDVVTAEDGAGWLAFLRGLRARNLKGVKLVVSDAHPGLRDAIDSVLRGASWQRCRPWRIQVCPRVTRSVKKKPRALAA